MGKEEVCILFLYRVSDERGGHARHLITRNVWALTQRSIQDVCCNRKRDATQKAHVANNKLPWKKAKCRPPLKATKREARMHLRAEHLTSSSFELPLEEEIETREVGPPRGQ